MNEWHNIANQWERYAERAEARGDAWEAAHCRDRAKTARMNAVLMPLSFGAPLVVLLVIWLLTRAP